LSARAIDYYVDEYTRTGFTGALNHYRCRDRNWEITSFLDGAVVRQPSLFIGGAADPSLEPIEIRVSTTGSTPSTRTAEEGAATRRGP
jgi:hypothetical protein